MTIVDSGERTAFETGAVRDMHEGKGRCDLLPMEVVEILIRRYDCEYANVIHAIRQAFKEPSDDAFCIAAYRFMEIGDRFDTFAETTATAILELAIHFEDGANKYGENNWRKGIPLSSYYDSAIRHLLKLMRGDTDERHDRALLWNIICGWATWKAQQQVMVESE